MPVTYNIELLQVGFTPILNGKKTPCHINCSNVSHEFTRSVLYAMTIIVYTYLVCIILAVAQKLADKYISQIHKNINFVHINTVSVQFEIRSLLNSWVLVILSMLIKFNFPFVCYITKSLGVMRGMEYRKRGTIQMISMFLSFWITILNLLLIVIANPSIKNPGPGNEDFTVLYQNVRGFVPFRELGRKIPPLDNNKLM